MDWKARKAELDRLHRGVRIARTPSLLASWTLGWLRVPRASAREPVPRVLPGQVAITFGGHATALVRYAGATIALDPMLGRWVGGVHRAVEPGLEPGDLAAVGLVLVSHGHADHLHLPTLAHLPRTATVIGPPGVAAALSPLGFARLVELRAGAELTVDGVRVVTAPLHHGDDELGTGNGYLIAGGGPSVFLCGDSSYGPSFAELGRRHAPDLALLPIGGFLPRSFRARHMSPLDALYAFEDLRARMMIPIHHGAFALSYERLGEPVRWLTELTRERGLDAHVRVLDAGESELFSAPRGAGRAAPPMPGDDAVPNLTADEPVALRTGPWVRARADEAGEAGEAGEERWAAAS